jgi:hypothetical protein
MIYVASITAILSFGRETQVQSATHQALTHKMYFFLIMAKIHFLKGSAIGFYTKDEKRDAQNRDFGIDDALTNRRCVAGSSAR